MADEKGSEVVNLDDARRGRMTIKADAQRDLCFACGAAPVPPLLRYWRLAHAITGIPVSARLCAACQGALDDAMHGANPEKYRAAVEFFYLPGPAREAVVARLAELFEDTNSEAVARCMAEVTAFLTQQFPLTPFETVLNAAIGLVLEGLARRGRQQLAPPLEAVLH